MRLTEKYRPKRLRDIKGQPAVSQLQAIALRPFSVCIELEGPPGCGKTTAALALAHDLGCDEWSTIVVKADSLGIAEARELMRSVRFRPMTGKWIVVVIEELTRLSAAVQRELQVALETELPSHVIVVATTNGSDGLTEAFRQRFGVRLPFGASQAFARAALAYLETIWRAESGEQSLPADLAKAGWEHGEQGKRQFSLRVAIDRLQLALLGRLGDDAAGAVVAA